MIDNITDIKNILEQDQEQEKTEKELFNNLVKYLYNIFDAEIRADLLDRAFQYFSYNETRKETCNKLAESQEQYNYYFINYTKALKQVKSFFNEDIKRLKEEEKNKAFCIRCGGKISKNDFFCCYCGASQVIQETPQKQRKQKQERGIFGVNPVITIIFLPLVLFFTALDHTK